MLVDVTLEASFTGTLESCGSGGTGESVREQLSFTRLWTASQDPPRLQCAVRAKICLEVSDCRVMQLGRALFSSV